MEDIRPGKQIVLMEEAATRIYIYSLSRGAMSQIAFFTDFETPPAPRSRPLRLPLHLQHSLHLQEDPEKLDLGECRSPGWPRETRRTNKSSILKFLDLKHRPNKKAAVPVQ